MPDISANRASAQPPSICIDIESFALAERASPRRERAPREALRSPKLRERRPSVRHSIARGATEPLALFARRQLTGANSRALRRHGRSGNAPFYGRPL
jgi:hypothetical protein